MPKGHPSKSKPTVGKSRQRKTKVTKPAESPLASAPPSKGGRPTGYTKEIGDRICAAVSRKKALASLCDADDTLPEPTTVYRWLRDYPEFCDNYTRAKDDQADFLAEDVLTVADDNTIPADQKRIMVDARKWIAAKLKPKKYADRTNIDAVVTEQTDLSALDDKELAIVKGVLSKAAERTAP